MQTHAIRVLMLQCLSALPSAPPRNALSKSPRLAQMISLYSMAKSFGALPDEGGLLDQRADVYAFFAVLANAEAEHSYNESRG